MKKGGENMQIKDIKRLIADEGKLVTNGELTGKCIDVATWIHNPEDFYEIDDPDYEPQEEVNADE